MLDFLKEIVEAVPDPSAGGTIDLDGEDGEGGKKKRGKGKKTAPAAADATSGEQQTPRKRRRKKTEAPAGSKPAQPAPETPRKLAVKAEMETERNGEGDQRSDGDATMEDADDYEDDASYGGYGATSYKSPTIGGGGMATSSEWRDADDDAPYIPRP